MELDIDMLLSGDKPLDLAIIGALDAQLVNQIAEIAQSRQPALNRARATSCCRYFTPNVEVWSSLNLNKNESCRTLG